MMREHEQSVRHRNDDKGVDKPTGFDMPSLRILCHPLSVSTGLCHFPIATPLVFFVCMVVLLL